MILGLVFAVIPLLCWALVTRSARVGWIVAAVLAVCVASGLALAAGWIRSGEKLTLLATLAFVSPLVIVSGIVAERHACTDRSRSRGFRRTAESVVSAACLGFSFAVVPLIVCVLLVNGAAYVPSGALVLPPPAGLAVAGDQDQGCSSGSHTVCSRRFSVVSTAGLPARQVIERLREQLAKVHGWRVNQQQVTMLLQGGN